MSTPDWVRRFNYLGDAVCGAKHIVGLEADELIAQAKATTGLSDFGDNDWQTDYLRYIHYLNSQPFDLLRRTLFKVHLLILLRNRLFTVHALHQQSTLLQQPIEAPVIITGMARTGTSILFELLFQDRVFRSPLIYEITSPIVPPAATVTGEVGRHEIAEGVCDLWMDIEFGLKAAHDYDHNLPAECIGLMGLAGIYFAFLEDKVSSYASWCGLINAPYLYRWHKITLQVLQDHRPTPTWLLKCPYHVHFLEQLFATYPDAKVIHTHRDPLSAILSFMGLVSNSPIKDLSLAKKYIDRQKSGIEKIISQRQSGLIPEHQITDIHFQDLMRNPTATLQQAYQQLGLAFTEDYRQKIVSYLTHKPRFKYGKTHYSVDDFQLKIAEIREQYRFYTDYYQIELEA